MEFLMRNGSAAIQARREKNIEGVEIQKCKIQIQDVLAFRCADFIESFLCKHLDDYRSEFSHLKSAHLKLFMRPIFSVQIMAYLAVM
jgi:hypothetical protein